MRRIVLLPLPALSDHATQHYTSPGNSRLREKFAALEDVLASTHAIEIPPDLTGRAFAVYSGILREKVNRAKAATRDPDGVQFVAQPTGTSKRSENDRETVEAWVRGVWASIGRQTPFDIEDYATDEMLAYGPCALRVLPDPAAWAALGGDDITGDAAAEAVQDALEDAEEDSPDADEKDEQTRVRRARVPVQVTFCPARSIIPVEDRHGLAEMWEFRQATVSSVLADYRDADGNPLARDLAASVRAQNLTGDDVATIVLRSDRTHLQIAVVSILMDTNSEQERLSARRYNVADELIYEGEHGMGMVPYALFTGRERPSVEPAYRWHPLTDDPVATQVIAYDHVLTQMMTGVRFAFWPGAYIKRGANAQPPGTGDKPPAFEYREGGINTSLGQDEEVAALPFFTAESIGLGKDTLHLLETLIDRQTFGAALYGQQAADSGYQQNLLTSAANSTLLPFVLAKEKGFAQLAVLFLRAARALFGLGLPAIPVRAVRQDEAKWETLTPDLAAIDWEITAEIQPTPVGGLFALFQTVSQMEQAGYYTKEMAMRKLGIRYPQRVMEQWQAERIGQSPEIQKILTADTAQKVQQALAQQAGPNVSPNTILPQPIAQALGGLGGLPPDLSARLPGGFVAPPGAGTAPAPPPSNGLPGLPNMPMNSGPANPPGNGPKPKLPGMPGVPGMGGSPFGSGQAAPGGIGRNSMASGERA